MKRAAMQCNSGTPVAASRIGAVLLALSVPMMPVSLAAAPPPWMGLRVDRQALAAVRSVNGVPLRIERFTGPDVPLLLQRWLSQWQSDGDTVASDHRSGGQWQVHARLVRASVQEVLQSRGEGNAAELLWSRLQLGRVAAPAMRPAKAPAGCAAGPVVEGRDEQGSFELTSAICRGSGLHRLRRQMRVGTSGCSMDASGNARCLVPLPGRDASRVAALVRLQRRVAGARR